MKYQDREAIAHYKEEYLKAGGVNWRGYRKASTKPTRWPCCRSICVTSSGRVLPQKSRRHSKRGWTGTCRRTSPDDRETKRPPQYGWPFLIATDRD
jgi:hypothetical protein